MLLNSPSSKVIKTTEIKIYLNGIVGANIVLVNGLQPSDVIVGVSDQMNVELPGDEARRRIVLYVLGLRRT
jgi:hypothetical protein